MFLSILTFDFDLILGSFLLFGALTGYFFGLGKGPKTVVGSTHVVKQLSFSTATTLVEIPLKRKIRVIYSNTRITFSLIDLE